MKASSPLTQRRAGGPSKQNHWPEGGNVPSPFWPDTVQERREGVSPRAGLTPAEVWHRDTSEQKPAKQLLQAA